MGGSQSQIIYAVPIPGTADADTTPSYRAATHPDELVESIDDVINSWQLFQRGKKVNPEAPCLGYRHRDDKGEVYGDYQWLTYNEVETLALNVGTALLSLPTCMDFMEYPDEPYPQGKRLRPLGLFSKNRIEWFICELAAAAYDFALVPLYDTLGTDAIKYMIERTQMRVVAVAMEVLTTMVETMKLVPDVVKYVIVFRYPNEALTDEMRESVKAVGAQLVDFETLRHDPPNNTTHAPLESPNLDNVNTICFTSGTTGHPKGVLLTHRNIVATAAAVIRGPIASGALKIGSNEVYLSYLPLAHVLERVVCSVVLGLCGCIGCYSGDTTKMLQDLKVLQPTVFVSVPRVFNRINDAVFKGIGQKNQLTRFLFQTGLQAKLDTVRVNANPRHRIWDPLVFNKTRDLMGNRLKVMISGGAPLDPVVQENIKVLFCAPLLEGYGLSETFGATFFAHQADPVSGHVGGVIPADEFRLVSVPEMSCTVSDSPPRGEIQIRGNGITPGYFRNEEETKNSFTGDGWFKTGDIGVLLPGGSLKIVDRKKNIFKLAQGEYVAPEKIEAAYSQTAEIAQIFLFGYSDKNHLVGIIVPDSDAARKHAAAEGKNYGSRDELSEYMVSDAYKKKVVAAMDVTAKQVGLKGFEKVKYIALTTDSFSIENGLLTPTLKIKRHDARIHFQEQIDALYTAAAATAASNN